MHKSVYVLARVIDSIFMHIKIKKLSQITLLSKRLMKLMSGFFLNLNVVYYSPHTGLGLGLFV